MAITEIADEFTMDITITRARYAELIRTEAKADHLSGFLVNKLEKYSGIEHKELEMLESMGLIRRAKDVSDT